MTSFLFISDVGLSTSVIHYNSNSLLLIDFFLYNSFPLENNFCLLMTYVDVCTITVIRSQKNNNPAWNIKFAS